MRVIWCSNRESQNENSFPVKQQSKGKPDEKAIQQFGVWLVVALPGETPAQTLDKAAEAAATTLFDAQAIGIELKLQGEYVGKDGEKPVGAQVVARRDKSFHALVLEGGLPGDGWDGGQYSLMESCPLSEGRVELRSHSDVGASAVLDENGLVMKRNDRQTLLKRGDRKSATLELQPPAGAVVLFGGAIPNVEAFEERKDIEGLTSPLMFEGSMMAGAVTKQKFRDYTLHVEFMTGWEPQNIPWRRADAGIYMLARYEVAIGDRFGFDFDLLGATGPNRPKLVDDKNKSSKFSTAKHSSAPLVGGGVFTYPSKVVPGESHQSGR